MTFDIDKVSRQVTEKMGKIEALKLEIARHIVGQSYMVERMIMGILADGHILLEGVPGLAKTTAVNALAKTLDAKFQRLQFTPDLLPADLIGTQIYNPKTSDFYIRKGPIFANIILADEINRAPAKVQSALLEAMQEKQVTIGDESFALDRPFLVLATQNPLEQEGTYPLPEAQVDRFMLKLKVGYPDQDEELKIINMAAYSNTEELKPILSKDDIFAMRDLINEIHIDEKINRYIVDIVNATRFPKRYGLPELEDLIACGASPRASIYLNRLARVFAFLQARAYVIPNDIKAIGMDVLRHRVIVTFEAEADEKTSEDLISKIFDTVKVP